MVRSLVALLGICTRGSVLRNVVGVLARCIVRVWARGVTLVWSGLVSGILTRRVILVRAVRILVSRRRRVGLLPISIPAATLLAAILSFV